MIQVLLLILPFGLAGAVSPMMLTEQTLLLAGEDGSSAGRRYAAAAILVLFAFVGMLVLFGRVISLPQEPRFDAGLDIAIGCLLLAASLILHRGRGHGPAKPKQRREVGTGEAFGFGAFSMATNFTTLALVIPAAKVIAASGLVFPERMAMVAVLVTLASTPAWLPVALAAVAPGPAQRGLRAIGDLIQRRGRLLTVLFLAGLGLLLIGRGVLRAAGV